MANGFSLEALSARMEKSISALRDELAGLRTGRASAGMLDPINVDAYGSAMPLSQLATVSVPESRMISVQVWDRSLAAAVEKAIRESGLGLNPIGEGANIRVPIPELNEERRRELTKVASAYAEQARVAVRHIRRDGMDQLKRMEKEAEKGKDEIHALSEKVQKATDDAVSRIDTIISTKEAEIMQV